MSPGPTRVQRTAARVIVRDASGLILLFNGADPAVPEVRYWFTPGGGLDDGETFHEAAARELREEASLDVTDLGDAVREDVEEFSFEGVLYTQRQRFFAVELSVDARDVEIDSGRWTDFERRSIRRYRWWSLAEIGSSPDAIYPADLADLVRAVQVWGAAVPSRGSAGPS
ncbi:MAG: NUDIX domain-containing protein [Actinomycetota bacterium]|nr:NUDIX domain-containing protein [Actinomycetota bacterium]